jgi:hypothetical protein
LISAKCTRIGSVVSGTSFGESSEPLLSTSWNYCRNPGLTCFLEKDRKRISTFFFSGALRFSMDINERIQQVDGGNFTELDGPKNGCSFIIEGKGFTNIFTQ